MKACCCLLLMVFCLRAEIVDRVALAIGYQSITELQLDEELRVTALLNHKPIARDASARRDAADRLIQQFLIEREMQVSRYPAPETRDVDRYLARVDKDFGSGAKLAQVLAEYQLDAATLRHHLEVQLAALSFIEARFRPEVSVSDAEVDAFLKAEQKPGSPGRAQVNRDQVRQQITDKQTDEALAVWLEEARKRFNIVYLDQSLQ